MHVVIWISAGQRYAVRTSHVVEVIPAVEARPIPGSAAWVNGLFNFRGRLIPLIDASLLLGQDATNLSMASRILIVQTDGADNEKLFGLLVATVIGSDFLEFDDPAAHQGAATSGIDFLGPVALTPTGTVQLTELDRIAVST